MEISENVDFHLIYVTMQGKEGNVEMSESSPKLPWLSDTTALFYFSLVGWFRILRYVMKDPDNETFLLHY